MKSQDVIFLVRLQGNLELITLGSERVDMLRDSAPALLFRLLCQLTDAEPTETWPRLTGTKTTPKSRAVTRSATGESWKRAGTVSREKRATWWPPNACRSIAVIPTPQGGSADTRPNKKVWSLRRCVFTGPPAVVISRHTFGLRIAAHTMFTISNLHRAAAYDTVGTGARRTLYKYVFVVGSARYWNNDERQS